METAIRCSQNTAALDGRFLYVDVTGRSLQLSRITSRENGVVQFESVGSPVKTPPFRAFEWSPSDESLVVVGQSSGEATLLKIAGDPLAPLSFQVRSQRACNAVALSTQNLLAAGLDKVRNDTCLNIWDLKQRLPSSASPNPAQVKSYTEPLHKLASSEPITSIKFFQNDPQLLVAGVKAQFIRLYDLREPNNGGVLSFATRCVNNLAIDSLDENYFASCYPMTDPAICLWDKRMSSRSTSSIPFTNSTTGSNVPEVSLELKRPIDEPGTIWSLRFSRMKRGHLGVLSSTGHLKVFDFNREYLSVNDRIDRDNKWGPDWVTKQPEKVYLERSQDIERAYHKASQEKDERARIVSFDFTVSSKGFSEPEAMVLTGDGNFKVLTSTPPPEPTIFSSLDYVMIGKRLAQPSGSDFSIPVEARQPIGVVVNNLRRRVESHSSKKVTFRQSRSSTPEPAGERYSSFNNQAWNADLGLAEPNAELVDIMTLNSLHRRRCEAGYLFSPAKNINIVSDSQWLQSFWAWIGRAQKISRGGNMIQDNLDFSFLGVHSIWMEDVSFKTRASGPSSNKVSRHIESLTRRLKIPSRKGHSTEYAASRKLCLYVSDLNSTYEELEVMIDNFASKNKHTKAAAIALFADERKLAYNVLRRKSATQNHRMLAMAIAGATRRGQAPSGTEDTNLEEEDDDWSDTIAALAEEMVDPYARAILALVRTGDWEEVVKEESLPLKYRVGIALRWFSDSSLTTYISKATKQAVADGDIEGVILTGTGTNASLDLMTNYVARFGDLQTAVLALSMTIPRYVNDLLLLRRFEQWREAYRHQINSWGLKYNRVRFDIGLQKFAVDSTGRKLVETPKPQISLVCGYCSQSLAQFDADDKKNEASHANGEGGTNGSTTTTTTTRRTPKHPLTSEKAAAIGTVCPKCGRHLPRCGVCDMWLGTPDPTHLAWYSGQALAAATAAAAATAGLSGSIDLSGSLSGSVSTAIGPTSSSSAARQTATASGLQSFSSSDLIPVKDTQNTENENDDAAMKRNWEETVRKFTVFCVKCGHGFHANHAREWFGGYEYGYGVDGKGYGGSSGGGGRSGRRREGHKVCPVSGCACVCDA